jgi:hypothetical protein
MAKAAGYASILESRAFIQAALLSSSRWFLTVAQTMMQSTILNAKKNLPQTYLRVQKWDIVLARSRSPFSCFSDFVVSWH